MNNLIIECVWCPSRREFNRFIRNVEKDMVKVIDHPIILNNGIEVV